MGRLIDADALNIITANVEYHGHASSWKKHKVRIVLADDIKNAPTIEITRCHKCKWFEWDRSSTIGYCREMQIEMPCGFFCALGERREDVETN